MRTEQEVGLGQEGAARHRFPHCCSWGMQPGNICHLQWEGLTLVTTLWEQTRGLKTCWGLKQGHLGSFGQIHKH